VLFLWCACVCRCGVLFSVGVCVCDLLIFLGLVLETSYKVNGLTRAADTSSAADRWRTRRER